MADGIVIYHNPRCSKSRQALQLLRDRGVEPRVVDYLVDPPGRATITRLIRLLDGPPFAIVRRKEGAYGESGLSPESTRAAIAAAIAADPILLERPVVIRGKRAVIARPPERALELLDG